MRDGSITLADGTVVPADVKTNTISAFGVLTDGRIVVARFAGGQRIEVFGPDGTKEATYPAEITNVSMGPTDRVAAWMAPDGVVQVLQSGIEEPVALATGDKLNSLFVDAVVGENCPTDCRVLVSTGDGQVQQVTPAGLEPVPTPEPFTVVDVRPDGALWSVGFPAGRNEQFGCVGLYDPQTSEVTARNCDTSFIHFSPDGRHLSGYRGDNRMTSAVQILDDDLQVVGVWRPAQGVLTGAAWSDPDHLLGANATDFTGTWRLVQVGLDGTDESVLDGPVSGPNPEFSSEYVLSS